MDIRHHRTLLRRHRVKLRTRSPTSPHPQKHHPTTSQNHRPQSTQHRSQIRPLHRHPIPHIPTRTPQTHQKITGLYDKPKPNKLKRYTGNRHIAMAHQRPTQLDGQRQLQRQNPPHVPQRTQRHHIHHTSPQHLQRLHSPRRMPQLRPRIPSHRHARSMGRNDQQTTSRRTKNQRHQSNPPLTSPNVPPLTTPHTTPITKQQTPNINRHRNTIRPTTRLQHPLPSQIRTQHRTSIR